MASILSICSFRAPVKAFAQDCRRAGRRADDKAAGAPAAGETRWGPPASSTDGMKPGAGGLVKLDFDGLTLLPGHPKIKVVKRLSR